MVQGKAKGTFLCVRRRQVDRSRAEGWIYGNSINAPLNDAGNYRTPRARSNRDRRYFRFTCRPAWSSDRLYRYRLASPWKKPTSHPSTTPASRLRNLPSGGTRPGCLSAPKMVRQQGRFTFAAERKLSPYISRRGKLAFTLRKTAKTGSKQRRK